MTSLGNSLHQNMLPAVKTEQPYVDVEAVAGSSVTRRLPLNHSIYTGLAISLNFVLCGLLVRSLMIEALMNHEYKNLGIVVVIPFLVRFLPPLFLILCD